MERVKSAFLPSLTAKNSRWFPYANNKLWLVCTNVEERWKNKNRHEGRRGKSCADNKHFALWVSEPATICFLSSLIAPHFYNFLGHNSELFGARFLHCFDMCRECWSNLRNVLWFVAMKIFTRIQWKSSYTFEEEPFG